MAEQMSSSSRSGLEANLGSQSGQVICYQDHASKLLRKLNETRKLANFCDTIVSIGSTKVPVQRGVLSAASDFFRALFDYGDNVGSNTQKDTKPIATISLDSMRIDESTFHTVLDYIYTAQVALTPENIQDMLQAADQLLMGDLKEICCDYLDSCIATHNCIGIFDLTSQLTCSWSHHKVSCFLDQNFRDVSQSDEFLSLNANRVQEFLSRTTIQMKQEDDVLDVLLEWYQYDPDNRCQDAVNLFKEVIFTKQLSSDSISKLSSFPHIGAQCMEWIEGKLEKEETGCSVMHRGFTQVIVTCGGDGKAMSREIEESSITGAVHCVRLDKSMRTADPESKICDWIQLASLKTPRSAHGLVEVGGFLYVAGGRDQNCRILNSCEKYDPFKNEWTFTAPMSHARVGFGFVAIENNIYAIGGSNDITEPSTSMEVYNIFTDRWSSLPDMMMKRVWACCVAAGKKIYVLGGGIVEKFYDSVEVFDTSTLTWSAVSPMRERRCDARAVSVGSDIYVFGGYRRIECPSAAHSGHDSKLCGTEMYSNKNDFWMPIQSKFETKGLCIIGERSTVYGALFDGEDIFVVGELDMDGEIHTIRSYSRHTNSWECVVKNSPPLQMHFPCCILSLPMQMYQSLRGQGKLRNTGAVMDITETGVIE